MERSGHVEFTKSKSSGTGNFRTYPFQQKGINPTAPQRSRYTTNTHRTQVRQTSGECQAPAPTPQLIDGFADAAQAPRLLTRTSLSSFSLDTILNESESDSLLGCCTPPIHRLKHLADSPCTRAFAWMRSSGFSRVNSSRRKRGRLLYRWHVAARTLKTLCWMRYGRPRIDYSRCSSLCRRMPGRWKKTDS